MDHACSCNWCDDGWHILLWLPGPARAVTSDWGTRDRPRNQLTQQLLDVPGGVSGAGIMVGVSGSVLASVADQDPSRSTALVLSLHRPVPTRGWLRDVCDG